MRLVFFCLCPFLCLQMVLPRHVGHDGFHNIEKEKRWKNWPARVKHHHKQHHSI
ncbi:uncharacterized protein LOC26526374 [Drosophila erecta]|uniref:Uncharacterized protein n=1 Tax=Drosophila erecta TaxID=7220 RepID=A0A0Q5VYV6_DROER|nr:uncharacterized protein LOC26526374 [Drosophila erecta]KQS61848.1 uncharacterized protein Dere_GG26550 [Drosophila erecta]